jgi:hypothetical protein
MFYGEQEIVKPNFNIAGCDVRIEVLAKYVREHPRNIERGLINLHVHTNESFSVFENPSEAVWYGYIENIEYFGINDHYTIDGHIEFKKACEIASIKPIYSIEAIAMDDRAMEDGKRYNDPNNAGRCYLVGKGVVRKLRKGSKGYITLRTMRHALRERNLEIVQKLNQYAALKEVSVMLHYEEVEGLTPRGNATERHVVEALCSKIDREHREREGRRSLYEKLLGAEIGDELLDDSAAIQTFVRSQLVKSGKPCYVREGSRAFTSIENLVDLYLEYGAIPLYPLMGNPITEEEEDLALLFAKMEKFRLFALEIIDYRTEIRRAREIIDAASHYGYPVFIGSEHNTKKILPLIGPVAGTPEFYNYFRRSANVVLGHQLAMELCDFGFVTQSGNARFSDLKEGFRFFEKIGEMEIAKEQIEELKKRDVTDRKKFFGI